MPTGIYQHKKGYKRPPFSKEWREKISASQKGKPNNFAGKKHSEETKLKISNSKKGQIPWIKGKTHSTETRAKISKVHKGRKATEETRKKMSEAQKRIGNRPPSPKGKKLSEETKIKLSEQKKGNKNHQWKGGITPINSRIRGSREYRLWKIAVFERDEYTCVWCFSKEHIEADHIKPFRHYPELRFAIDNGRTLCRNCHKTTETWGQRKLTPEIKAKIQGKALNLKASGKMFELSDSKLLSGLKKHDSK